MEIEEAVMVMGGKGRRWWKKKPREGRTHTYGGPGCSEASGNAYSTVRGKRHAKRVDVYDRR